MWSFSLLPLPEHQADVPHREEPAGDIVLDLGEEGGEGGPARTEDKERMIIITDKSNILMALYLEYQLSTLSLLLTHNLNKFCQVSIELITVVRCLDKILSGKVLNTLAPMLGSWIFHKASEKTFHVSCFEHSMTDTAEDSLVVAPTTVDDKNVRRNVVYYPLSTI